MYLSKLPSFISDEILELASKISNKNLLRAVRLLEGLAFVAQGLEDCVRFPPIPVPPFKIEFASHKW